MKHFPAYETIVAFNREKDGIVHELQDIDIFGNTPEQGKFDRKFVYNGAFWAVWAHYYPESKVVQ